MAKKREFASDSDISRFITKKQSQVDGVVEEVEAEKDKRQQFTIYPDKNDMEQVKIVAKLRDVNLNTMLLQLIRESLAKEEYQKAIRAYKQLQESI